MLPDVITPWFMLGVIYTKVDEPHFRPASGWPTDKIYRLSLDSWPRLLQKDIQRT
jgi:hypothetical protein